MSTDLKHRLAQIKDKKLLITAGPTWVPIDRVRVISNVSNGLTGITIAQYAAKKGADVTLLLGPVIATPNSKLQTPNLKVIRFKYFDELQELIKSKLKKYKYDIIIHPAAVSDYKPIKFFNKKIRSDKKSLAIFLKPTPKIIDDIRRYAPAAFLVMFKLEVKEPKKRLIEVAYKNLLCSGADLVVANNISQITENRHKAYIVDLEKKVVKVETKEELTRRLFKLILEKGNKRD